MYLPKRYGEAKLAMCPFCSRGAYSKNPQGIPVCSDHTTTTVGNVTCSCGQLLDLREGKWGPFFLCVNCGPVNFNKALTAHKEAVTGTAAHALTNAQGRVDIGWKTQVKKPYTYVPSANAGTIDSKAGAVKGAIGSGWKAKRDEMWRDEHGQETFIRSDDPRYEFK
jgi:hypothetical protein